MTKKLTLREVKKWEDKAINLYNLLGEISAEEAAKMQSEIYKDDISYDYGDYNIEDDIKKEYYTKGAADRMFEDFDPDLTYIVMRINLYQTYNMSKDTEYFDIN